jgi:ATP-dependent Clp protease ATP-binding subunit ClpA
MLAHLARNEVFERFTFEAGQADREARRVARAARAAAVDELHLLVGCCSATSTRARDCLERCGVDEQVVVARAWRVLEERPFEVEPGGDRVIPFATNAKRVLELAKHAADELGHQGIGSDHLLLGVLRFEGVGAELLRELGASDGALCSALLSAHRERVEEDVTAAVRPGIERLRAAHEVCVELGEAQLAAALRELIEELEHPRREPGD